VIEDGVIPSVNGTSEKFRRIGNRYNIRTAFKSGKIVEFALQNIAKKNYSPKTT
jgi:hypothetical protein